MTRTHVSRIRRVVLPALAALGFAALVSGCVVYPGHPGYGYYHGGWGDGWHH